MLEWHVDNDEVHVNFHRDETDFAEEVIKLFFHVESFATLLSGVTLLLQFIKKLFEYVYCIIATSLNTFFDVANETVWTGKLI